MNIYLCGFMGVGKTTIGAELATLLKLPFIDMDEQIAEDEQMSIPQIFAKHGESYFRELEQKLLLKLCRLSTTHIIALGGGTLGTAESVMITTHSGICVYLYKPWNEIHEGLKNLKDRPLLASRNERELHELFYQRSHFYEQSQLTMPINTAFEVQKLANLLKILTNR